MNNRKSSFTSVKNVDVSDDTPTLFRIVRDSEEGFAATIQRQSQFRPAENWTMRKGFTSPTNRQWKGCN